MHTYMHSFSYSSGKFMNCFSSLPERLLLSLKVRL